MKIDETDARNAELWNTLMDRVEDLLEPLGQENHLGNGDYWIYDSFLGHPEVLVYINNLALLEPSVIKQLQQTLGGLPGTQIVVALDVLGAGETWPNMGLKIRQHEIIDGLQRQYFPEQFRNYHYEGSRPGTERD